MQRHDPENADLLAALGRDLPEHLRFRNGLAPWERHGSAPTRVITFAEELAEKVRNAAAPPFVVG